MIKTIRTIRSALKRSVPTAPKTAASVGISLSEVSMLRELTYTEGWGVYEKMIETYIQDQVENLLLTGDDHKRGFVNGLRQSLILVEWAKAEQEQHARRNARAAEPKRDKRRAALFGTPAWRGERARDD